MGTLGLGSSEVGLATTCMTRSPQTSIRMVPAAVLKVTPFGSLWDSLMANRGSFAANAAELASNKTKAMNLLVRLVRRSGIVSPLGQRYRHRCPGSTTVLYCDSLSVPPCCSATTA